MIKVIKLMKEVPGEYIAEQDAYEVKLELMREVTVGSLTAKRGGVLVKRIAGFFKRANTDPNFRMALRGLFLLVEEQTKKDDFKFDQDLLSHVFTYLMENLYDELMMLIHEMTDVPMEELEVAEIGSFMELLNALIATTDFTKVMEALKNSMGLLQLKVPALKASK